MNRRQAITCLLLLPGGPTLAANNKQIDSGVFAALREKGKDIIDIKKIGADYLNITSDTDIFAWLKRIPSYDSGTFIDQEIAHDLATGRLVRIDGWYISLTQARVAALNIALS